MITKLLNLLKGKRTIGTAIGMAIFNFLIIAFPELKDKIDSNFINQLFEILILIFMRLGIKNK